MVARGEAIYAASCQSCHGADLRGSGPAAAGLDPPPADFSAPHTMVHSTEDLVYWIRHGKQGTAMPAFDGELSDQDIRDVLAFIQARQQAFQSATPASP
jgi:putative copper resistance protein D